MRRWAGEEEEEEEEIQSSAELYRVCDYDFIMTSVGNELDGIYKVESHGKGIYHSLRVSGSIGID